MQFCVAKLKSSTTSREKIRDDLNNAIKADKETEELLSITQAASQYLVLKPILYCRIYGRCDQVSYRILKQKLTLEKKEFIKSWVLVF